MLNKKCCNCGANLTSNICEYCGTHFNFGIENEYKVTLNLQGENNDFYIANIETFMIGDRVYRNEEGLLVRPIPITKRKITLIEY